MKRVIELIRVSTQGQADDDRASIPAQHTINYAPPAPMAWRLSIPSRSSTLAVRLCCALPKCRSS